MREVQNWPVRYTAHHIMGSLGVDLYANSGACLWELVRNGLVACMPDNQWMPGKGHVEIQIVNDHSLSPGGPALVVLDHGSGFTDPNIKRFCLIGPSLEEIRRRPHGSFHGASQKRQGRFAALSLNSKCLDGDAESGVYVLTRTTVEGAVRYVEMIPSYMEIHQAVSTRLIDPDGVELGPQRGIRGSFTVVVIPCCVFGSHKEVEKALLWRLPRDPTKAVRIMVGSKRLMAPPLSSRVTHQQPHGPIAAFIDRFEGDPCSATGGVWFTDLDTGFRVVPAWRLHTRVPFTLCRTDLTGDIMIPGLLANQDSGRTGLRSLYLRSKPWRDHLLYLSGHVVPEVEALIGSKDAFGDSNVDQGTRTFLDQCAATWGAPDSSEGPLYVEDILGGGRKKGGRGGSPGKRDHKDGAAESGKQKGGVNEDERKRKRRAQSFRVGDRTFVVYKRTLDPRLLVQVHEDSGNVVLLNNQEHPLLPRDKRSRELYVAYQFLTAIGISIYPRNAAEVPLWVADRMLEMQNKK